MKDNQISMINNLIEMIEANIREDMDLDVLAVKAGFSKFYIHRLFKALTGESLMSYVRGRRLSLSLNDLLNTHLNMIDIAQEYRFSHEQSYIRAFKQQFHMTPAHYRQERLEMPVVEKLDTARLHAVGEGLMLEPRMCLMPQFYLQGIEAEILHEHNYLHEDTNQLIKKWEKEYFPAIQDKEEPNVYFGLVQYNDNPSGRLYAACTRVKAPAIVPEPIRNYTIPTHNYAAFRYVGMHSPYEINFRILLALYEKINAWKEETSYVQADGFHIERVGLKNCDANYCEMDIYVPIHSNKR